MTTRDPRTVPVDELTPAERHNASKLSDEQLLEITGGISDADVLRQTGRGKFGPGIVGVHIAERSRRILHGNPDGKFGPAILDHAHHAKQVAALSARLESDGEKTDDELLDLYHAEAMSAGATEDQAEDMARRRLKQVRAARRNAGLDEDKPHTRAQAAAANAAAPYDPKDLKDPRNPWSAVTLSGAKQLASKHGVSYRAGKTDRKKLIELLQEAKVEPPPLLPDNGDDEDDRDEVDGGRPAGRRARSGVIGHGADDVEDLDDEDDLEEQP